MYSFYSERTAEYALVPRFAQILKNLGPVVPIYFLKNREGNNVSQYIHKDEKVSVVAFFARRPKVNADRPDRVLGKINSTLYEFSRRAYVTGVPTFCGLPITLDFFELQEPDCLWFHVNPKYTEGESIFYVRPAPLEILPIDNNEIRCLTKEDVLAITQKECRKMPWSEAVTVLSDLYRRSEDDFPAWNWWTRNWHYRPMYFILRAG